MCIISTTYLFIKFLAAPAEGIYSFSLASVDLITLWLISGLFSYSPPSDSKWLVDEASLAASFTSDTAEVGRKGVGVG